MLEAKLGRQGFRLTEKGKADHLIRERIGKLALGVGLEKTRNKREYIPSIGATNSQNCGAISGFAGKINNPR